MMTAPVAPLSAGRLLSGHGCKASAGLCGHQSLVVLGRRATARAARWGAAAHLWLFQLGEFSASSLLVSPPQCANLDIEPLLPAPNWLKLFSVCTNYTSPYSTQ